MASLGTLAVNIVARTEKFARGITRSMTLTGRFKAAMAGLGGTMTAAVVTTIKLARTHEQLQKSMNASLAIMGDVSKEMRNEMTAAAIEVSRTTRFAAHEAADAYFFLASAGFNAAQSLKAMPQVAAFAQAGNFDLALATDLATDAQSAMGLTSKDTAENLENLTRVTDVLIKANTLANASAQQFSESITNKAGAALRIVGKDIEEGAAVLAAYADQGIKGAEAGTALGIVMRDLQTKALKNASAFRRYGVDVFDMWGNMQNLADIIKDVEQSLDGLNDASAKQRLLNLGFSDKSVAYLQVLVGTSEKIRGYEKALRDAGGITKEVADKQMTPMSKLLAKLNSQWEQMAEAIGPAVDALANWAAGADKASSAAKGLEKQQQRTWSQWLDSKPSIASMNTQSLYRRAGLFNPQTETEAASPERLAQLARQSKLGEREFALAKAQPAVSEFLNKLPANMLKATAAGTKRMTDAMTSVGKKIDQGGSVLSEEFWQRQLGNLTFGLFGKSTSLTMKQEEKKKKTTELRRSLNTALTFGSREAAVASSVNRHPLVIIANKALKEHKVSNKFLAQIANKKGQQLAAANL